MLTFILFAVFTLVTGLLFAGMVSRLLAMNFGLLRRLAAGVLAVILLAADSASPQVSLLQLCGYSLLIISAVLVLRVLALIFRRER